MSGLMEARPPYVVFELRPVEDRQASLDSGRYVAKDIAYAIITPQGSKDRTERIAEEWLKHITVETQDGRFPDQWLQHYRKSYELWQQGQEMPLEGTPIVSWPVPSPAQVKMLLELNIRTVEELAATTEEGIAHLGIGARALKQRAVDFLSQSGDAGKAAAEMERLRVAHAEMQTQNEELKQQLATLTQQVKTLAGAAAKK